jgi:predicted exporter
VTGARVLAAASWLALLAACAWQLARTPVGADLSAFLPRAPTAAQQALVDQLREGPVSRLLLLAIESADEAVLAALSERLRSRLAQDDAFLRVDNGAGAPFEQDAQFLRKHRYLLSPGVTAERFSAEGLRESLQEAADLLGSPGGLLAAEWLASDPTGELLRLLDRFEGEAQPARRAGVWFSADGRRALLIAQTRAAGLDIGAQQAAQARLHAAFAEVKRSQGAERAALVVSGPAVFAAAARSAIKRDAERLAAIAAALVAGLLWLALRSPGVLLLALLPAVTAAAVGAVTVSLLFGVLYGVTLGFGVTLIGEAVDYAIYLFTRSGPGMPPSRALERIWPTLRLGVATSVVGFGAMLFSGFPGLSQIAVFSVAGLIAAALTTRVLLPVLAPREFHAWAAGGLGAALLAAARVTAHLRLPALLAVVAAAVWLALRSAPLWDDDLSRLSPVPEAAKRQDEQLRRALDVPDVRHLVVAASPNRQLALEAAERAAAALDELIARGALAGYESPTRFLPSQAAQRLRQQALPDAQALERNLEQAMRELPFRPGAFEPFLADVAAARAADPLDRWALDGTALGLRVDALLSERGGQWYALLPLRGVRDSGAISDGLARLSGSSIVLLDLKRDADALYRGYRNRALAFSWIGAAAIALLLLLGLRSMQRLWEVLAPLAAAVVLTVTILVSMGQRLTLFHLVALLLVVGVGSNYSLFFERENLLQGDPRRALASLALCSLSTVIVFGLLGTASTPVLSAIGTTVAIGAALSLLFSAVFSSALRRRRRY